MVKYEVEYLTLGGNKLNKKPWDKGIAKKMLTEEQIAVRVAELGAQITKDLSAGLNR